MPEGAAGAIALEPVTAAGAPGPGPLRRAGHILPLPLHVRRGVLAEFESALSYRPDNAAARTLYLSLGFTETDEWIDDGAEVVARRGG